MALWGCSSDDVVTVAPAPLPSINEEVSLKVLWSEKVGSGLGEKFTRIKPTVLDNTIFAASTDGVVVAYDRMTGDKRWEVNVDAAISGGVGAGENKVFVGTLNGELVALNAEDGSTAWHVPVSSEVLSVPQIDNGLVVTQSNDDTVIAFDVNDGSQRWSYNDTPPPLTIRGTASPLLFAGAVIIGLANGRVVVLSMAQGEVIWDRAVSAGEGRTELERLRDVDGSPSMNQGVLFVGNYQGRLAAFDARSGEIKWQNDLSTLLAPVVDSNNVYVTDAESNVLAFDQPSGSPAWSVKDLNHRSLTAPVIFGDYAVVADFEGYVHLLSTSDGHFAGRERADSDGVRVQPLVADDALYVYGNGGKLIAYQLAK
jgi:outer membrane protein assembly factor BamB